MSVRPHLAPGMFLGEYELTKRLGGGGMSDVYSALQLKLKREVAIKVLSPDLSDDAQYAARFVREAQTVARLQHRNIVPIFDYGTTNDWTYLVMPFLRGGTLTDRILRQSPQAIGLTDLPQIADFLLSVCAALHYAHMQGVVHCDIKPGNILFDEHGAPILADFGIAMIMGSKTQEQEQSQFMAGSFSYMSPELWQGEKPTPKIDQYALGLTIYALVTGHPPFGTELSSVTELMRKHLNQMPIPVHFLRQEASEAVNDVIMRAIAKHPADRFESVLEFAEAFHQAVSGKSHPHQIQQELAMNELGSQDTGDPEKIPAWAMAPTRVTKYAPVRVSRTSLAEMGSPEAKIFISYRRADSSIMTGRIYDRLIDSFGADAIFRDLNSIPLGTNFKRYLENVVRHCVVELVMIGKDWLNELDESGRRRLDNPDDFVRVEIEAALVRDIPIIPILIDGATMPSREQLPPSLGELVYCNGDKVRVDPDFSHDMDRLIGALSFLLRPRRG